MAKKAVLAPEAERLYVAEGLTLEEIAARLGVSVRSLQTWSGDGGWPAKRGEILGKRHRFDQNLFDIVQQLGESIKADLAAGVEVSSHRLYAYTRLLPLVPRAKEIDAATRDDSQALTPKGLTKETIERIEEEFLGVRR